MTRNPTPSAPLLALTIAAVAVFSGCVADPPSPDSPGAAAESVPAETDTENESAATGGETTTEVSFYTVDHYDLKADPAEQLQATLQRAKAEHKRVLLQVGGDWCGWCKLMTGYIADTDSVNQMLADHYLIQKVTYDQKNKNEAFLSQYPEISGYPHLFVLDADGELLHSQNTSDLEEGKGYSESAFIEFLSKWKPE